MVLLVRSIFLGVVLVRFYENFDRVGPIKALSEHNIIISRWSVCIGLMYAKFCEILKLGWVRGWGGVPQNFGYIRHFEQIFAYLREMLV